jgi:soluble lytic murein transglycosylase-like protein
MKKCAVSWFFAAFFTLLSLSLSHSVCRASDDQRISGNLNRCLKYWPQVIRESRYHVGMDAPVHDFMGQIEIESNCNAKAIGITGDIGLGQFNLGTARWLQKKEKALREIATRAMPLNPAWSIRALILFDKYLYENVVCQDWHYAFRAYNGGLALMNKEIARARTCEYKAVEAQCRRNVIRTKKDKLNLCLVNITYPVRAHAAGEKYQAVSVN